MLSGAARDRSYFEEEDFSVAAVGRTNWSRAPFLPSDDAVSWPPHCSTGVDYLIHRDVDASVRRVRDHGAVSAVLEV